MMHIVADLFAAKRLQLRSLLVSKLTIPKRASHTRPLLQVGFERLRAKPRQQPAKIASHSARVFSANFASTSRVSSSSVCSSCSISSAKKRGFPFMNLSKNKLAFKHLLMKLWLKTAGCHVFAVFCFVCSVPRQAASKKAKLFVP